MVESLRAQLRHINAIIADIPGQLEGPIRETVVTQAALVRTEIKSVAPVDSSSKTPGALKASVRMEELPPKKGKFLRVAVKAGGKATRKEIRKGSGEPYDYARAVEFGTQNARAHPFFFPIWRARRKDVRAAVKKAIKQAVKEVKF